MRKAFSILALMFLTFLCARAEAIAPKEPSGAWIGARETASKSDSLSRKSILLRKEFTLDRKALESAVINISGLGFYELYVNGHKIGEERLQPQWSDYDKSVYFNSLEIRRYLKKGDNCIAVMLGNGFYNVQGGRYTKFKHTYGPPTLLAELVLAFKDGSYTSVQSSTDWKWSLSPVTFNCIFGGEDYDARLEQKGWNRAGFDDSGWNSAIVQKAPEGELLYQQSPSDKVIAVFRPKSQTVLPDGRIVLDMAQNLSGVPSFKIKGKKGQTVKFYPAELLDNNGIPNQKPTGSPHCYVYTIGSNNHTESYTPHFSYYGYRYLLVEGAALPGNPNPEGLPVLRSVKSLFLSAGLEQYGSFSCSNEIFNGAHRLISMAIRSNMHAVFTDCPHREKLGWLEQLQFNGPVLHYNFDLRQFAPKIMRDMADAQHQDGMIPTIAPEYVTFAGQWADFSNSPEWGSAFITWPLYYYRFYKDTSLLEEYYPKMRAYLDYLTSRAEDGVLSFGLGDWYDYSGGLSGFAANTSIPMVASAQYYLDILAMEEAARILGKDAEAGVLEEMALREKELINIRFFDTQKGSYDTGSQAANAIALYLGLVPDNQHDAVLKCLLDDIKAHDGRLTTGEISSRFLYGALHREGLDDVVYSLHNHYDAPGYGCQLAAGATTLTEQWDPSQGASQNHFMFGHLDEWFYSVLAGIQYQERAPHQPYDIVINPVPAGDLTFVKAEHMTIKGLLKVQWKISKKGRFSLAVDIPENLSVAVQLPGTSELRPCHSGYNRYKR